MGISVYSLKPRTSRHINVWLTDGDKSYKMKARRIGQRKFPCLTGSACIGLTRVTKDQDPMWCPLKAVATELRETHCLQVKGTPGHVKLAYSMRNQPSGKSLRALGQGKGLTPVLFKCVSALSWGGRIFFFLGLKSGTMGRRTNLNVFLQLWKQSSN